MASVKKIGLYVSIPEDYFCKIRKIVAKHNLNDPTGRPMTAARLAMEFICKQLDEMVCKVEAEGAAQERNIDDLKEPTKTDKNGGD